MTLTIDTIDRRRDVQRLERLGATCRQVRGAAALYTAVLLAVVTWLSAVLVMGLVTVGADSFNRAEPAIPVPFSVPSCCSWRSGSPRSAAGLAALVARPAWLETDRSDSL